MKSLTDRIIIVIALGLGSVGLMSVSQSSKSTGRDAGYFFKTPGEADSLQIARIYGDAQGETHFEFINLLEGQRPNAKGGVYSTYPPPQGGPSPTAPFARVGLPLGGNFGVSMIAGDAVVPALHALSRSYFLVVSGPGFEWKATDGTGVHARPGGPIFLADEQGSKGHITRGLGLDSVFLSIPVTGDSPKRACANAPKVLDCLLGK